MEPDEYERLVKEILEELFSQFDNTLIERSCYGQSNLIHGASGFPHQIDVSIESKHNLILVECKCWNNNVPVEKVLAFYGRMVDIQPTTPKTVVGLMATTKGYQKGVPILAKHFDVNLGIFKSVQELSFEIGNKFLLRKHERITVSDKPKVEITEPKDPSRND